MTDTPRLTAEDAQHALGFLSMHGGEFMKQTPLFIALRAIAYGTHVVVPAAEMNKQGRERPAASSGGVRSHHGDRGHLKALAAEFDAAPAGHAWEPPHPIFQMAADVDRLNALTKELAAALREMLHVSTEETLVEELLEAEDRARFLLDRLNATPSQRTTTGCVGVKTETKESDAALAAAEGERK